MPQTKEERLAASNAWKREKMKDPAYRAKKCAQWNERYGKGTEGRLARNARARELRAMNPEAARKRERETRLRQKYSLSPEDYESMLSQQSGLCAICLSVSPGTRDWHVDHDHTTGIVRGLLCHGCNTGLGLLGTSIGRLTAAAAYLIEHGNTP